jgi:hypothetical protein
MAFLTLSFYGVSVNITASDVMVGKLRCDFSYFAAPHGEAECSGVAIGIFEQSPPYERVPPIRAWLYRPDAVVYDRHNCRYVDYLGNALSIYDYDAEEGELYGEDVHLLHELAYLLIHSRVGELLDKKGLHRVHALGLNFRGKGVLCLLPQGGGKTTLLLELLKEREIKFLSDDTPLISAGGLMNPFPVRIGISGPHSCEVPEVLTGKMVRRHYGPKTLIDTRYFAAQISTAIPVNTILIGAREFSREAGLFPVSRHAALSPLFKHCVAGLGLPQMVEYFLRTQPRDIISKLGIFAARARASLATMARSRVYVFVMGRDVRVNADALSRFLNIH